MTCPVALVIANIHGAGIVDNDDNSLVKIGGAEWILDSITYYITAKQIELARFELSRPNAEQCKNKLYEMFKNVIGKTYNDIFIDIMANKYDQHCLLAQLTRAVSLISGAEDLIMIKLHNAKDSRINVTIPEFSPQTNDNIIVNPTALKTLVDNITTYINKLNINAFTRSPAKMQLEFVTEFSAPSLDSTKIISAEDSLVSAEDYIKYMKKILLEESEVAEYGRNIEKYHTIIINYIDDIYSAFKNIMDNTL